MLAQISLTNDAHDFTEGSFAVDANCDVGLSVSQQPPRTFCMRVNDPSKQVDLEDLSGADTVAAAFESFFIDKSSMPKDEDVKEIMKADDVIESSVFGDDERKDNFKGNDPIESSILKDDGVKVVIEANDACETKCPNVASLSAWRSSSRKCKSHQENEEKRPARNCRKAANKKVLFDFSSLQFTRRRRSSLCKRARSTVWGLLGNIAQVVEKVGRLDISLDKPKRSRRPRGVQSNRKQEKNLNIQNSEKFKGKTRAPAGLISLKIQFGRETASVMNVTASIDQNIEKGSAENSFHEPSGDVQDLLKEEVVGSMRFQSCDGSSKKASGMHLTDKDTSGRQGRSTSDDPHDCPFHGEVDKVGPKIDNRVLDSGTSTDSEVINTVPDAKIGGKVSEELHPDLISYHGNTASGDVFTLRPPWKRNDQGRRKDELHHTGGCSLTCEIPSPGDLHSAQEAKPGQRENMGDGSYSSDASTSTMTGNAPINTSNMEGFSGEHLSSSRAADFGISKVESRTESNLSPKLDVQLKHSESLIAETLLPVAKGQKLTKSSAAKKVNKSKSEVPNSSIRREKTSKKKGNQGKSAGKSKNKEKGGSNQILHEVDDHHKTGNYALFGNGETDKGNISSKEDRFNINSATAEVAEECITPIPPRCAWVRCDVCHKWRRIPAILADKIEEPNCRWVCKDNLDNEFADCSIPQEKSNAEINAELEISDASCEEDARDACLNSNKSRRKPSTVNEQSPWSHIKSNLFLCRRRKTQTIDEIMVCGCKPPLDGRMGCGGKCLNRMLNIECIPGTCPCGECCSNKQFQKRKFAKLKSFRCGKKGYGLQLVEDVSEGQFLIEYVGEVLDMHAYEARQRDYAVKGHKHFYFMTLNGSEVIDACAKGNLGRFINHSCDPNCRTEKWMVNGEVCIGIFALRDIKKGEEVTFDYNYVRVFGAAAKKCVCGSSQCRGYIGGDPLNSEVIIQGDSDEEYPEPVMVYEDGEMDQNLKSNMLPMKISLTDKEVRTVNGPLKNIDETDESFSTGGQAEIFSGKQTKDTLFEEKLEIDSSTTAAGCSEITKESRVSINMSASSGLKVGISMENECSVGQHSPIQPIETSLQPGDVTSGDICAAPEECSATEKSMNDSLCSNQGLDTISLNIDSSFPATSGAKKKLKPVAGENEVLLSKFHSRTKISGMLSSVKKRKPKTDAVNAKKPLEFDSKSHGVLIRPKRLLEDQSNGHFEAGRYEAVQEKLNELLDPDGGISKRKDASRGYLKLLLLTAASGDSGNGEAIQSNRDLSMILDALLKTKSRTVLADIINKNGLQMLHNIMKRYRKEFIKIPILRKLLKVLEYLATREILTYEHINGGPRCPGVESFRDSILTLTEHTDKQVHQIARNFRDRWISRCFRMFGSMDRDDCRVEFHGGPNHDKFPASHNYWKDRAAKPSEILDCDTKSAAPLSAADTPMLKGSASRSMRKRKSRWDQPYKETPDLGAETDMASGGANNIDEDVPPGFSSPLNGPVLPSDASSSAINHWKRRTCHPKYPYEIAMGHSQQRFISRISVAYGVPIPIVEQFGTQQSGASESWITAPGMPFQPFPPLPPYPRDQSRCTTSQTEQDCHAHATFDLSQDPPTASGVAGPDSEASGAINQLVFQLPRGYNNLGRKYFRQQKWNSSKLAPPWVRIRNGWGSLGNNTRNGMCQPGLGSGPNEFKSSRNAQDNGIGVQYGNTFHQHH